MNSIRRHLTLSLLAGFAVLLGVGCGAIYVLARAALYREYDTGLRARALTMASLPKAEHGRIEFEFREQPALGGETNVTEFFQFYAEHGGSLRRSRALGRNDLPAQFGTFAKPIYWDMKLPNGRPGRVLGVRFIARGEHEDPKREAKPAPGSIGLGLVLAADRSHLDETLRTLAFILAGVGLLALAATVGFVSVLLREGLAPLRNLASQTERIDASSLKTRLPTDHVPAELAPIVHRLNDLLSRLDASFERERRFSADLAHELRTPIAALRTLSEVSLKWSDSTDAESFQSVLEIAGQMQGMITRLLALARAEQKTLPIEPEPLGLANLVDALWEPLREKAARKRLGVRFEIPIEARIETDPGLFRGILVNLLTNAVEYSPAGGVIRVSFSTQAGQFALAVANTVHNLEPSDLPNLFQRFWRKDKARSDAEHSGLGLSLVKSFAELLGLELAAALNGGADELTLTLTGSLSPRKPDPTPGPAPSATSGAADQELALASP
jgi:signal transduction histidine kinase